MTDAHSSLLVPKVKADHNSDHQQACPCCKVNIPDGCLGKHLVSHFHYHRSLSHPDHKSLILSNISDIVKQAPFQCGVCKFYCNFSRTFLEHWKSHYKVKLSWRMINAYGVQHVVFRQRVKLKCCSIYKTPIIWRLRQ